MESFPALLAICAVNSPVTGEFPTPRPVTRSIGVFFDLCLNKVSKQSWGWWLETSLRSLCRYCNVYVLCQYCCMSIWCGGYWTNFLCSVIVLNFQYNKNTCKFTFIFDRYCPALPRWHLLNMNVMIWEVILEDKKKLLTERLTNGALVTPTQHCCKEKRNIMMKQIMAGVLILLYKVWKMDTN